MIKHLAVFRFRKDVSEDSIHAIMEEVRGLSLVCPGILDYEWGSYSSPEGFNREYSHGFVMTFDTAANRNAYLVHPEHQRVAQALIALLEGGLEGAVVFDFETKA